jgi:hypothetical protein
MAPRKGQTPRSREETWFRQLPQGQLSDVTDPSRHLLGIPMINETKLFVQRSRTVLILRSRLSVRP